MELRAYLRILLERWWIVLIAFAVTYATTLALTFMQPERFESRATFVIGVNAPVGTPEDLAALADIIARRPEIPATFAEIAGSNTVKNLAADQIGLSPEQRGDMAISSRHIPGTTTLEIAGEGSDRVLTQSFTNAVGQATVERVKTTSPVFTLAPLDQANLPNAPSSPNKPLNLALGAIAGLVLGVSLAFFSAYLQAPPEEATSLSIRDEDTGVYNKRYLLLRLQQELNRAKRNKYSLAVGLLNLNGHGELSELSPQRRRDTMRKAALIMKPYLRDEDVLARYGDTMFGFLLPDQVGETARETIADLQMMLASAPVELEREGVRVNVDASAGVAAYHGTANEHNVEPNDLLQQAMRALQQAETATYGRVLLLPGTADQAPVTHNGSSGPVVPFELDPHRTKRL